MKTLYTLKEKSKSEIKIKRSIFIGRLENVNSVKAAKEVISSISKENKTASHNCWAYIIGDKAELSHFSDSGEVPGTAGKPIINTLFKYNLSNVVVVITRYYGGTKLGIRGLIEAYSESADETIKLAELIKLVKLTNYEVKTDYDYFETLKYQLNKFGGQIKEVNYDNKVNFIVSIESNIKEKLENYLQEYSKQGKLFFSE